MKWLFLALVYSLSLFVSAEEPGLLRLIATIKLPGVTGRFDHFAIDTNGHRLFVAALGNNTVEVLDVSSQKHLTSIRNLQKPTGLAFIPNKNQIVAGAGNDAALKLFDGVNYKMLTSISVLDDADNVRFDSRANRIYLGYGDG